MTILDRLLSIDRRIIFLLMAIVVIIWYFIPLEMPVKESEPVLALYQFIEKLGPDDCVMIAVDYDPASAPELFPMSLAVLRHCFKKKIKVLGVCLWPTGEGLGQEAMTRVAREFDAKEGEDYCYLGYMPGYTAIILGMGEDILEVYPRDATGKPTRDMPIFKNIRSYKDIAIVVDFAASGSPTAWITFAHTKYEQKIAAGVTAVMAADFYPYLHSEQLVGLINGLKGAAEYEKLVERPEKATLGMNAQSAAHLLIILFIIIGNVGFFRDIRRKKRKATA